MHGLPAPAPPPLVPRFQAGVERGRSRSYSEAAEQGRDVDIVRTLVSGFDVSWQALLYRLEELGFIPNRDLLDQGDMELRR